MRIIAGKYGRRKLEVPKGRDIRPTSDKIRGAIFNALEAQGALKDAKILDAFCGTGALGLEALSRGAKHCLFLDKDKNSLDLARRNADMLIGAPGSCTESAFQIGDAAKTDFKGQKFDLIFLDPPYHKGLIELTLKHLLKQSALSSTGRVICESETNLPAVQGGAFDIISEKSYGDTLVRMLKLKNQ